MWSQVLPHRAPSSLIWWGFRSDLYPQTNYFSYEFSNTRYAELLSYFTTNTHNTFKDNIFHTTPRIYNLPPHNRIPFKPMPNTYSQNQVPFVISNFFVFYIITHSSIWCTKRSTHSLLSNSDSKCTYIASAKVTLCLGVIFKFPRVRLS